MTSHVVIAECIDTRTGKRLFPGNPFPAGGSREQIERLQRAGSIREMDAADTQSPVDVERRALSDTLIEKLLALRAGLSADEWAQLSAERKLDHLRSAHAEAMAFSGPPAVTRDPFDHDGDGRPGGSLPRSAEHEVKAEAGRIVHGTPPAEAVKPETVSATEALAAVAPANPAELPIAGAKTDSEAAAEQEVKAEAGRIAHGTAPAEAVKPETVPATERVAASRRSRQR